MRTACGTLLTKDKSKIIFKSEDWEYQCTKPTFVTNRFGMVLDMSE